MAPKRKNFTAADKSTANTSAKSIYLVVEQSDSYDEKSASYAVVKVDPIVSGNEPASLVRAHRLATIGGGTGERHGMSFVSVHSKHGSWIVGAGCCCTIIFDPIRLEIFQGPGFVLPRDEPVVISHGGEVEPYLDFQPWFQSLSFNNGVPSLDSTASWSLLTDPPFFPYSMNPYGFDNPPQITVTSYAAVGSHILFSPQPELNVGTYGFHVVKKAWEKVCDDNLPSVGQAVPLGGDLFAGCPMSNNPLTASASVFRMSLTTPAAAAATSLSIQEFLAVVSEEKIPSPFFCPLGKGRFCSIRLGLELDFLYRTTPNRLQIILTTIQAKNNEAILTAGIKDLRPVIQVNEHIR